MIRRYLSLIIFSLFVSNAIAQDLWISGTAVPGGTQKLTQLADGDYKYAGRLNAGELRIMSTRKAGKQMASDTWSYNQQSRLVTVNIPHTSCQQSIVVKLNK